MEEMIPSVLVCTSCHVSSISLAGQMEVCLLWDGYHVMYQGIVIMVYGLRSWQNLSLKEGRQGHVVDEGSYL